MRSSLRDLLGDLPTTGDHGRQNSLLDDLDQQSGRRLGGGGGFRLRILDNEDDYYASCRGGRRGPPPELDLKTCAEVLGTESGEFMVDFSLWPAVDAAADDGDRSRIASPGSTIRMKLRKERSMTTELMKELPRMLPLLPTIGSYGRRRLNRKTTGDGRLVISSDFGSHRKDGEDEGLGKIPPLMSTLGGFGRPRLVSKRATTRDGRLVIEMEQCVEELDEEEEKKDDLD